MTAPLISYGFAVFGAAAMLLTCAPAAAGPFGLVGKQKQDAAEARTEQVGGRALLLHVPTSLPPAGKRALVVVLHGGLGNAANIADGTAEQGLNLNKLADANGFIVAYLNGTEVARKLSENRLGWNAGGCCGVPAADKVDDVGYIQGAVKYLSQKYGIDKARLYGIGHSNGGMMTARVLCETGLYAAAVSVSGPLELDARACPAARGKRMLDIHGAADENVPVAGGYGTKGFSHANFRSESDTQQVFKSSGVDFTLDIVDGADHYLAHIDDQLKAKEGTTVAEKAVRFFRLTSGK